MRASGKTTVVVLGSTGRILNRHSVDATEKLNLLGQNSGNLVFQYAANGLFAGPIVNVARSELPYRKFSTIPDVGALVFPAANHIRLGADWTSLSGFLRRSRVPLIVLGLGAQAPDLDGRLDVIDQLRADATLMDFIAALREKAAFISVRGHYTQTVCQALGLRDVEVLG
ncbi:MAG: hypothetical protein AAGG11_11435, partial [Pseudomonadota bacterium]